jgi:Na+/proline symporter
MGRIFFWIILLITFLIGLIWSLKKKKSIEVFLASNRNLPGFLGLLTVAAAWTWAPALLVSSQKSYELGLSGFLWFSIPNIAAIFIFYFLSKRMHKINKEGYTLPEFIRSKTKGSSDKFYIITILLVQIYAIIINLIGSGLILQSITGLPKYIIIPSIALVAFLIVYTKGLFSSLGMDYFKSALILALGAIFAMLSGDFLFSSFVGQSGTGLNLLNPSTILAFGIPTAISLISAITVDQQQWQRSFALKKNANLKLVYFGGAIFFAIILIFMALPGFIANSLNLEIQQTQTVSLEVINYFFNSAVSKLLLAVILTSLVAVICASLSASASVWTVDIKKDLKISSMRGAMILILIIASAIVFVPNLQIIWIVMFVGSFRSSLLIPTFIFLFSNKLSDILVKRLNKGILIGMIFGPLIFLLGLIFSKEYLYTVGSLFPIITTFGSWLYSKF